MNIIDFYLGVIEIGFMIQWAVNDLQGRPVFWPSIVPLMVLGLIIEYRLVK